MKFNLAFLVAMTAGARFRRSTGCPGTCWTRNGNLCEYDTSKVILECSAIGSVSVSIDPCIFTQRPEDFSSGMEINTVKDAGTVTEEMFDGNCARPVTSNGTLLQWQLNYAQAAQCGWSWSSAGDGKISLSAGFRPSDSVESYIVQNQTILTSLNLDRDIHLACHFEDYVTLTEDFNVTDSDFSQDGDVERNLTMNGFAIDFDDKNETTPQFTVGDVVRTTLSYDWTAAGFSAGGAKPFGFYLRRFHIHDQSDQHQLYLVGSSDGSVSDTCEMDSSIVDLHVTRDNATWTSDSLSVGFDAFTFDGSGLLSVSYKIGLCLAANCDAEATQVC